MKILYLYQYFGTPKGSWSTRVYEMCRRWVREGHSVTVITTPYDKSDIRGRKFIDYQYYEGIEVIVVNVLQSNKDRLLKRSFYFLLFSLLSVFFAFKLKYDVVIASSGPITIGLPALMAKMFRGKLMIFEVRDLWPRGGIELGIIRNPLLKTIAFWFERACYQMSSLIVACSKGMADDIIERYPKSNVVVVPNACDVELFQNRTELELPDDLRSKKIVIYAGSLGLMDNCIQIVNAAIELQRRACDNIRIVVLGEGAERRILEQVARENVLHNIIFLGLKPKEEVVKWLGVAKASLVVFKDVSVLDTSSPNKFFDSLAAGLPIIQTTQGWIKDIILEQGIGFTVEPNNPREMAEAIIEICGDVELQKQMSANALNTAIDRFDRNKLSAYLLRNIEEVVYGK